MLDDPQITGFRYQLDDENPEDWIYTAPENNFSNFFNILDGSKRNILFFYNKTYDGVNWSASAISMAYPLFEEQATEIAPLDEDNSDLISEVENIETSNEALSDQPLVVEEEKEVVEKENILEVSSENNILEKRSSRCER